MTDPRSSHQSRDALDELITSLLECGGVLSQIISSMVRFEASGRTVPDTAPIPEMAHSLIRSVVEPLASGHCIRDMRVAAKIVDQMTAAMCEDIYAVDLDWFDELTAGGGVTDDSTA